MSLISRVLWTSHYTQLILNHANHLAVKTIKDAPLINLSDAEIIDHEKTVGKMEHVFQELWGCGDFNRWTPLSSNNLTTFLTPARTRHISDPEDGVDMERKVAYMLNSLCETYDHTFCLKNHGTEIHRVANQVLNKEFPSISIEDVELKPLNVMEAIDQLLDYKKNILNEPTVLYENKRPLSNSPILNKVCKVFCNKEIVDKQLVYLGEHVFVTCNNRPYSDLHLMVLPKIHKEKLSENTDNEILEKYQIFLKISEVATHVGIMTRCGPRSGQTQPHLHDHIVGYGDNYKPLWVDYWLCDLTSQNNPSLSMDEMNAIKEEWTPILNSITPNTNHLN